MISNAALQPPLARSLPADASGFRLPIGMTTLCLALAVLAVVAASFSAALALIAADVTRQEVVPGLDQLSRLTKFLLKFDVGAEQTVAAWLSSMLMLLCALALCYHASLKRQLGEPYARHWLGLAVIFLGLSLDEAVGFHEMTITPMRELLDASGAFLYAWVVPALVFVGVVAIVYLGFLWHLDPALRLRFLLAGGLFVGGAIGFEMMEGAFAAVYEQHRLLHEVAFHLEDSLEFAGVLIFLHSLLAHLRQHGREVTLRLV